MVVAIEGQGAPVVVADGDGVEGSVAAKVMLRAESAAEIVLVLWL